MVEYVTVDDLLRMGEAEGLSQREFDEICEEMLQDGTLVQIGPEEYELHRQRGGPSYGGGRPGRPGGMYNCGGFGSGPAGRGGGRYGGGGYGGYGGYGRF